MRCVVLFAMILTGIAGPDALAQKEAPVQPGQRVRVRSTVVHTPELTGVVESIGPDTLRVRDDDRSMATAVSLATVDRLQVSRGRHSRWVTGAAIGLGVGVAAGVLIGLTTSSEDDWLFGPGASAFLGAVLFGPIGAVTGGIVGLVVRTERWETVPLDRAAPGVARGSHLDIGMSVAF